MNDVSRRKQPRSKAPPAWLPARAARRAAAHCLSLALLLSALAGFAPAAAQAQSGSADESEAWPELLCPILRISPQGGGRYDLQLRCGGLDGIAADSRTGPVIRRHQPGKQEGAAPLDGKVALKEVHYLDSEASLSLDAGTPAPSPGDLVPLEIRTGPAPDQSLYHLSRLAILFARQDGTPWVLYRDYHLQPGSDYEGERLPLMLAEIAAVAAQADAVYGTEPLSEGAFAGQTLGEAMRGSSLGDLRDFFAFVKAFPGKYIGQSWKLPEVYATWIINGAPGPEDEDTETIPEPVPDPDTGPEQLG